MAKENNFYFETLCEYKRPDGTRGWILTVKPKPKEDLFKILEKYRKKNEDDCIVPLSGGRDSSYALHLIVKELKMKPITYTYDWGMTSDIGRRNIKPFS